MLKGATIQFYCLFDNYIFQTSVLIMECIELNWLCKEIKKIRSSQPAIPVPNWVKHQSFPVNIVKSQKINIYWEKWFLPSFVFFVKVENSITKERQPCREREKEMIKQQSMASTSKKEVDVFIVIINGKKRSFRFLSLWCLRWIKCVWHFQWVIASS